MKIDFPESHTIEFKEKFDDQKIIKSIIAFLNADGGQIYIGIKDDCTIIGIPESKIDEIQQKLSHIIKDQIEPNASECVEIKLTKFIEKKVIIVDIKKGLEPIYYIKKHGLSSSGCFIRKGSTCQPMPSDQIKKRSEQRFEVSLTSIPTNLLSLSFSTLKTFYEKAGLTIGNQFETNLNFRNQNGQYNMLAELLSDNNRFTLRFIKFDGLTKAADFKKIDDYGRQCLLSAFERLKIRIEDENIMKSDTSVRPRIDTYLYDNKSVMEAIINAIVHNDWRDGSPEIYFFNNRMEIFSWGGLPFGLNKEGFFNGISKPRNKQLMDIFLQLEISERTGHGIPTIVKKYGKRVFKITDNYVNVVIPFNNFDIQKNAKKSNNSDYLKIILKELTQNPYLTANELALYINKSEITIKRYLKELQKEGYIKRSGPKKTGAWKILKPFK